MWLCCFCKQKTAYDMRISDWSSDVCSSDLTAGEMFEEWHEPARRDILAPGMGKCGGIFGEPRLVVPGAEDQLHDRRHRRARLDLEAGVIQYLGIILGLGLSGEREIIGVAERSEEHTSELQSLMRISYAVFCLKKKTKN